MSVTDHNADDHEPNIREDGFTVVLVRRGKRIFVPAGSSILFELLDNGIDVPYSCGSGTCGTCETDVLEGTPEHRDFVLTEEERAAGDTMMICCSGSLTDELHLDL